MAEVMLEVISDGCDSVRRFSVWRRLSSLCSGRGWGAMRFGAVAGADDEFDGVELGRGGDVERQPLGRRTSSGSSSAGGSGEMRWVSGLVLFRVPGGGVGYAGQVLLCAGVRSFVEFLGVRSSRLL